MKRKLHRGLSVLAAGALALAVVSAGAPAQAAGSVYVNGSSGMLGVDIGSAYAVGGTGEISVVGGAYAITGTGNVEQIGQGASTAVPSGDPDGTTVSVSQKTVRIGLYYYYSSGRNTALTSANLENKAGSGYKLGYYDSGRSFIELG
ncbi:MAG: hypothetical protein LBL15_03660, partial [Oscillospiraceae bacterium]|nr:hypothetical protein [Oscillospiraceae bacterium]